MYPDLLNLHGERASVQMLTSIGENMGIQIEIQKIQNLNEETSFEQFDLLIFLPGEISTFQYIIPPLSSNDSFRSYVEDRGYVLAIGTTGLLFGREIRRLDGTLVAGLGYLDMTAREREYVWGDDLHIRLLDTKQELVGSQIQMADVSVVNPLAQTIYGMGNNNTGAEGARYKNLIYTNCLGPLFVKNPWFAESMLKDIWMQKHGNIGRIRPHSIADNSFVATLKWIAEKPKKPKKP